LRTFRTPADADLHAPQNRDDAKNDAGNGNAHLDGAMRRTARLLM